MSTAVKVLFAAFIAAGAAYVLIPEFRIKINEYVVGVLVPPPQ